MATYTPNYGLHQWVPEDTFLRTDFNEDLLKIDTAMKEAEEQAANDKAAAAAQIEQVKLGVETTEYHCMNLMLQNYYEGKAYAYMRGLALDGFLSNTKIESTTSGLTWNPTEKNVILQATGVSSQEEGFETRRLVEIPTTTSLKQSFTAPSTGTITAVELYFAASCTVTIEQNGVVLGRATASAIQSNYSTRIPITANIERGGTYQICLLAPTSGHYVYSGSNNMNFGYRFTMTPTIVTNGTLITTQHSLGSSYQRASAWVRHSGGMITLSLYNQQSGSWVTMPGTGKRTTVTTKGDSCVESAFRLASVPTGNTAVKLRLTLSTTNGVNAMLYDYGVAVI